MSHRLFSSRTIATGSRVMAAALAAAGALSLQACDKPSSSGATASYSSQQDCENARSNEHCDRATTQDGHVVYVPHSYYVSGGSSSSYAPSPSRPAYSEESAIARGGFGGEGFGFGGGE